MTWALAVGRSSFAIAFGVVIGAVAAAAGVQLALRSHQHEQWVHLEPPRIALSGANLALPPSPEPDPVTIVDVSRSGVERAGGAGSLIGTVGVAPDEQLVSINGRDALALPAADALVLAWVAAGAGDYLDLELVGVGPATGSHRRVLVLLHD